MTTIRSASSLTAIRHLSLAALVLLAACHPDVDHVGTESATDGINYFDTSGGGESTGAPTPLDFCQHRVDDSFPGNRFVCAGEFSSTLVFDYHGDPEISIKSMIPCITLDEKLGKDDGYVYTCYASVYQQPFGLDVQEPYGGDIDACCLSSSPQDFVEDFCRIDAGEELCIGAADGLNDLRTKIPVLPKFSELNDQLLNLNEFIAAASQQSECAQTLASKIVEEGSINGVDEAATWLPDSPKALDEEDGWPWLRNIRMNITGFSITGVDATDTACVDLVLPETEGCDGLRGSIILTSPLGDTKAPLTGDLTLSAPECASTACPAALRALAFEVGDIDLGVISLSEISASLTREVRGELRDDALDLRDARLTVSALVAAESFGIPAGTHLTTDLDVNRLQLRRDPDARVSLEALTVTNWPVSLTASTAPATCKPL
ncbi:MAG TPA: hypothetical protein PKW35_01075 [Nannocystaceae bacterium]|nr:hypothetical protein [Nannocystaceae bacterium]